MTSPATDVSNFLVEPQGGQVVMEGPLGVVTKIPGAATNGVMSIVEHPVAPRLLVPPHVHQDHDEWSYVLEGRIGARIGDDEFIAEAGSYILKPRRIPTSSGTRTTALPGSSKSSRRPGSRICSRSSARWAPKAN
jgi:mannose-6-phosphate isomerase-like protein (cupin superfamily)